MRNNLPAGFSPLDRYFSELRSIACNKKSVKPYDQLQEDNTSVTLSESEGGGEVKTTTAPRKNGLTTAPAMISPDNDNNNKEDRHEEMTSRESASASASKSPIESPTASITSRSGLRKLLSTKDDSKAARTSAGQLKSLATGISWSWTRKIKGAVSPIIYSSRGTAGSRGSKGCDGLQLDCVPRLVAPPPPSPPIELEIEGDVALHASDRDVPKTANRRPPKSPGSLAKKGKRCTSANRAEGRSSRTRTSSTPPPTKSFLQLDFTERPGEVMEVCRLPQLSPSTRTTTTAPASPSPGRRSVHVTPESGKGRKQRRSSSKSARSRGAARSTRLANEADTAARVTTKNGAEVPATPVRWSRTLPSRRCRNCNDDVPDRTSTPSEGSPSPSKHLDDSIVELVHLLTPKISERQTYLRKFLPEGADPADFGMPKLDLSADP